MSQSYTYPRRYVHDHEFCFMMEISRIEMKTSQILRHTKSVVACKTITIYNAFQNKDRSLTFSHCLQGKLRSLII